MLAAMPRSPTASTAPAQRSFGWAPTQVRPGPVKVSSCPGGHNDPSRDYVGFVT